METQYTVRPPPPQSPSPASSAPSLNSRDSYNEKDIKDYGDYREQGSIELSEDESDSPIEEVRVTISSKQRIFSSRLGKKMFALGPPTFC